MRTINKLVLFHETDDVEKAKTTTHLRLIKEILIRSVLGGEQFGTFLEVIHNQARETYQDCVEFSQTKNKSLDAAKSTQGRWFFHKVQHTFVPDKQVIQRLLVLAPLATDGDGSMSRDDFENTMLNLGLSKDEIMKLPDAIAPNEAGRIDFKDLLDFLSEST